MDIRFGQGLSSGSGQGLVTCGRTIDGRREEATGGAAQVRAFVLASPPESGWGHRMFSRETVLAMIRDFERTGVPFAIPRITPGDFSRSSASAAPRRAGRI